MQFECNKTNDATQQREDLRKHTIFAHRQNSTFVRLQGTGRATGITYSKRENSIFEVNRHGCLYTATQRPNVATGS